MAENNMGNCGYNTPISGGISLLLTYDWFVSLKKQRVIVFYLVRNKISTCTCGAQICVCTISSTDARIPFHYKDQL